MKKKMLRVGMLCWVMLGIAGCDKAPLPPEPSRPVLTMVLGAQAEHEVPTYAGEVRSRYETQLGFRIPGKIAARLVDAGAQVKAGEVLARLDPADTTLSATAANAQLQLAEADVHRYRELRNKNFVSQSVLDAKETTLKATRAQAELAHNQSDYTVLRADQAGVVELVAAEVGQVVAAGQAVMRVARTDTLEVAVVIPEARVPEMRLQKAAQISLWSDAKASYQGVLRELSPMADAVTRTYAARVTIQNPDDKVLLGMSANVSFPPGQDATSAGIRLSVPLGAIFQQEGKPALWVVGNDQTVSLRPVEVASFGENNAIITSGVKSGERIVIAGVHKLSAGEKIRGVDQTPAATSSVVSSAK